MPRPLVTEVKSQIDTHEAVCAERWKGRGGSRVARLGSKQLLGADTPRAALRGVHADGGSRGLSRGWGARGDEPDPLASNLAQPALFFDVGVH